MGKFGMRETRWILRPFLPTSSTSPFLTRRYLQILSVLPPLHCSSHPIRLPHFSPGCSQWSSRFFVGGFFSEFPGIVLLVFFFISTVDSGLQDSRNFSVPSLVIDWLVEVFRWPATRFLLGVLLGLFFFFTVTGIGGGYFRWCYLALNFQFVNGWGFTHNQECL